jgi:hypothetical protein
MHPSTMKIGGYDPMLVIIACHSIPKSSSINHRWSFLGCYVKRSNSRSVFNTCSLVYSAGGNEIHGRWYIFQNYHPDHDVQPVYLLLGTSGILVVNGRGKDVEMQMASDLQK